MAVAVVLSGLLLVVAAFGQDIMEAKTVVTYERGFDNDVFDQELSRKDIVDTIAGMRKVVVPVGNDGVAFLQEDEEDEPTNMRGVDLTYPSEIRDGRSYEPAQNTEKAPAVDFSAGGFHMNVIKDLHHRNLVSPILSHLFLVSSS